MPLVPAGAISSSSGGGKSPQAVEIHPLVPLQGRSGVGVEQVIRADMRGPFGFDGSLHREPIHILCRDHVAGPCKDQGKKGCRDRGFHAV